MNFISQIRLLKKHVEFRRYVANTSWLMGEKILRMFVGLFVGVWIARYLGPEQFGLFSYAQSFVFLFTAIATLGLDNVVVRELVRDQTREDELLGTAFVLKIIGAVLVFPLIWLALQFTSNDAYTKLLVFIIVSATIFQSFNVIDFYYQSKVLSKYVALANSVVLGASSLIKIILILNNAPLTAFAMMFSFDALVLSIGLIFFYEKRSGQRVLRWSFSKNTAIYLIKESWPLILSSVFVSLYMRIDQIMIKEMLDAEAVGQYAAAVRLSEAWYFIPMAITSSIFPAIINARKVSEELYLQQLQRLYTLMVWLGISIALPMTFLSEWIVSFLYGDSYQKAADILMIHAWAGIFVFLGVASGKWLIIEGMVMVSFFRVLAGVIISIILNFIMIPSYGVVGAAISILVSQAVAAYGYDFF
ncbi:flippase [Pseudomonas sp. MAFF 302030]|uniref:Flippase n=1 Tax=Pseudomonas morbosilactucae TaxID=2938197 RepID=A0A9X2C8W4_9PSED|nr:flippase [Pseudomonas morbosilactucae]MCK9801666.1 flippase [Pseudomonas morbosilactucae]